MDNNRVKFLLSLDYELFFGARPGSVEKCMISPTRQLVRILDKYNAKVSLFVDAGFLIKLKQYAPDYPELKQQYLSIKCQLQSLIAQDHDIQLHIHPHWQDSYYTNGGWVIDTSRYRLHDFSQPELQHIVKSYKQELESCSDNEVFAYRAGGWCMQPFDYIRQSLEVNNIWLDSTVFANGHSDDPACGFNFNGMPDRAWWNFSNDPLQPAHQGFFTEIPISTIKTSPLFFWKLAFHKKLSGKTFQSIGDGQPMIHNRNYYLKRLTQTTFGPVMIDGAKAGQLPSALKAHCKLADKKSIFNVMGHPKSLSRYSLIQLDRFIKTNPNLQSVTYQDFKHLKPPSVNIPTVNDRAALFVSHT